MAEEIKCEEHGKFRTDIYPNGCPICLAEEMGYEESKFRELKHIFK